MGNSIIQEIINDITNIDPSIKMTKKELESLIQELIENKPKTPFTNQFKIVLKKEIIQIINKQKATVENKKTRPLFDWIKYWIIGFSTITTWILMFIIFNYIQNNQNSNTQQIAFYNEIKTNEIETNETVKEQSTENKIEQKETISTKYTKENTNIKNSEPIIERWEWASNEIGNVMIMALPEREQDWSNTNKMRTKEFLSEPPIKEDTIKTFCKTSKEYLVINNITENTSKFFIYNNKTYKVTINFTNNSISILNTSAENENKIEWNLPNLNIFFEKNNFAIQSDYLPAIIEETEETQNYYFPRINQQEGISAKIDKNNNKIVSIENICIY